MKLHAAGKAYWCDLTADQIQERAKTSGKQGYDGYSRDRGLAAGPGHVLRFRVPEGATIVSDLVRGEVEFANDTIEDFVLLRSNGSPMFLLANVVDDIEMRITHVVRAEEHLPNTPKQQMLWEALGATPPIWAHVPVLVNEQRKKLSKRRDKVALEQYREEGILPDAMINYLMTLGWAPAGDTEIVPWSSMVEEFRLEDVNHSPAFFDIKKLASFNGDYIRAMSLDGFIQAASPVLASTEAWPADRFSADVFVQAAPLVQTRVVTDFTAAIATADWNHDSLKGILETWTEANGLKLGKTQAPIRVAITGRTVGPPLFESLEILGREETIRRLTAGIVRLG
jgi:glutamyl-tRNA synthetase